MPARTAARPADTFWVHRDGVRHREMGFHHQLSANTIAATKATAGSGGRAQSQSPPTPHGNTSNRESLKTGSSRRSRSPGADVQQREHQGSPVNFNSPASVVLSVLQEAAANGAAAGGEGRPPFFTEAAGGGGNGATPPLSLQQLGVTTSSSTATSRSASANPRFAARNRDYHGRDPFATSRPIVVSPVAVPAIRAVGDQTAIRNRTSPTLSVSSSVGGGGGSRGSPSPSVSPTRARSGSGGSGGGSESDAGTDDIASSNNSSTASSKPEFDQMVKQIAQRILAQRARAHHDDPALALTMGQRAAEAKNHKHRRPERQQPRHRDLEAGVDGPLGAPLSEADRGGALKAQQDRANWGSRFCACNSCVGG
jgi:hypothetical protein